MAYACGYCGSALELDGEIVRDANSKWNQRATELSADGREGRLWKHRDDPTREQHNDDLIRWAFWQMTKRQETQHNRESTDEAFLLNIIATIQNWARGDEQRRFGAAIANGLRTMLGDDASLIVSDVANDFGMFDND